MYIKTVYGWVPLHVHSCNSNDVQGVFRDTSLKEARAINALRINGYVQKTEQYLRGDASYQDVLSMLGKPLRGAFNELL